MSSTTLSEYSRILAASLIDNLGIRIEDARADSELNADEGPRGSPDFHRTLSRSDAIGAIASAFEWHARRLHSEFEDFGSLLVLELLADGKRESVLGGQDLHRLLSRIRMRLLRDARKHQTKIETVENSVCRFSATTPLDQINDLLSCLESINLFIVQSMLEGRSRTEIASALNMSRATFYRHLSEIRREFLRVNELDDDPKFKFRKGLR
jgi:hypothetical protein